MIMASSSSGSTQNLREGRAEALQALLNSISPGDSSTGSPSQLTSEQVKKISDRLGELLGNGDLAADVGNQKRNEKGELLNEEGLPIIDIVEPVTDEKTSPQPANVFDDPDLLPLWALSPAEKARRRAERERILDLLEAEESLEQEREEAAERERTRADLEKRKEAAKDELESLRKAKELQKKMGKALLRNVIEAKEREEQENARREEQENAEREERRKLKPKKSVTFAEPLSDDEKPKSKQEGGSGDVSLARLQLRGKNTLLTQAQIDKQPMKMHVVERNPGGLRSPPPPPSGQLEDYDSDDESDPGSPIPADSDEGDIIHSDHSDDDHLDQIRPPPSSESEDGGDERMSDDGEPVEWREDDFDFAQHQREIALAYYEKRATIGAEVASAMRAHSHEGEHEWDQPEVPLEATLASGPPKPSISRFKSESASSGMSSSTLASHSLGPSVLPASQSSTLKSAIRMGKLQNGQLFGDESDDDVEEEARKIVELLSQGEVTNIGPQPISISSPRSTVPQGNAPVAANSSSVPSPAAAQTVQRSPAPRSNMNANSAHGGSSHSTSSVTAAARKASKVSKFKLTLAKGPEGQVQGAGLSPSVVSPALDTPQFTVERSSPKLASPGPGTPIPVPTPTSPRPPAAGVVASAAALSSPGSSAQRQMPSMIVESPSFRPPTARVPPRVVPASESSAPSTPTAVGWPAPLSPQSAGNVIESPSFQSVIIDSPSFNDPTSFSAPAQAQAGNSSAPNDAGPTRPAFVMAAEVKESSPASRSSATSGSSGREKKVSRFLAERL